MRKIELTNNIGVSVRKAQSTDLFIGGVWALKWPYKIPRRPSSLSKNPQRTKVMESSIGMETISYIKARVLEAKNGSQPPGYRQLLDQVYERLERLEQLVSNTPEIRECQNFESGRNSIRGMLDQFRQQDFDQQLYRMFSKDLSTATESYRKQARCVPSSSSQSRQTTKFIFLIGFVNKSLTFTWEFVTNKRPPTPSKRFVFRGVDYSDCLIEIADIKIPDQ